MAYLSPSKKCRDSNSNQAKTGFFSHALCNSCNCSGFVSLNLTTKMCLLFEHGRIWIYSEKSRITSVARSNRTLFQVKWDTLPGQMGHSNTKVRNSNALPFISSTRFSCPPFDSLWWLFSSDYDSTELWTERWLWTVNRDELWSGHGRYESSMSTAAMFMCDNLKEIRKRLHQKSSADTTYRSANLTVLINRCLWLGQCFSTCVPRYYSLFSLF
jgi:hypothetical protein